MRRFGLIVLIAQVIVEASAWAKPSWLPAVSYAGAPACSQGLGVRTYYGDIVQEGSVSAEIVARTERQIDGCHRTAELLIARNGVKTSVPLTQAEKSVYSIVDFSPDGSQLLLSVQRLNEEPDEEFRTFELATIGVGAHDVHWINAWDLYGWKDCDAMVEPQGFTADGGVLVLARPSAMVPKRRRDCVPDWGLYRADLHAPSVVRLPDSLQLMRYAKVVRHAEEGCRSDPDIVGPGFTLRGRLSLANGTPSLRIWRIGTNRILGVDDGFPPPEPIASHLDFGIEAFADFLVFPLTSEHPHEMQMVCIESARNITFRSP